MSGRRSYVRNRCPRCHRPKSAEFKVCFHCKDSVPEDSWQWRAGDAKATAFYVYILRLNDGSFYAGQTRDIRTRMAGHQAGGTISTAGKEPVLVWFHMVRTRKQATDLEFLLKSQHPYETQRMIDVFNSAVKGDVTNFANQADIIDLSRQLRARISDLRLLLIGMGIALAALSVFLKFWEPS